MSLNEEFESLKALSKENLRKQGEDEYKRVIDIAIEAVEQLKRAHELFKGDSYSIELLAKDLAEYCRERGQDETDFLAKLGLYLIAWDELNKK